jgi:hypothetical protein
MDEQPEVITRAPVPLLPPGWTKTTSATTETVPGREGLKKGSAGTFVVFSDEAADYGGQGEWPSPLNYAALAIGW